MYLTNTKAKGKQYIYLRCHAGFDDYQVGIKKMLYAFGRKDKAIRKMYEWKEDFNLFPQGLKELGCTHEDLLDWIRTMETGIAKSGRVFTAVI